MKPTIEILERISQNSKNNSEEKFTRLFRYMLRPDIYYVAYKKLYANNGAGTKGIDDDTADGFSEMKIEKIIKSLADESYVPKPCRRTYIEKANGKKRPLGIPTFTDKLIQEVLRMILESVYEPIFLQTSHGFRPKRSCHTALFAVSKGFNGIRWFVEGDIKGCFDNIDHSNLIKFICNKIKDAKIRKLIYKFLKAGYMEDWKYNNTYSGTPQGGIISPILANIYLHELDKFVNELAENFEKPPERAFTREYYTIAYEMRKVRNKLKVADEVEKQELLKSLKVLKSKLVKTPCKSQTDKKIKYVRYADDFLIGVCGTKEDCEKIKIEITNFVSNVLNIELSEEKTLITHSNTHARFLGYDVRVRRNNQVKFHRKGVTKRTLNGTIELNIPLVDKIEKWLFSNEVIIKKNSEIVPQKRNLLLKLTDLEILNTYNSELRGICNYYNIASNYTMLNYFSYLMEYSCLHTLACKHKSTISKIKVRYKDNKGGWCISYQTKKEEKRMYFAKHYDCKSNKWAKDTIDNTVVKHCHSPTTFESRLKAKRCEICGTQDGEFEIHHINKVKNLKGKKLWEQIMIAKRRKTIVVCVKCHIDIHRNK